MNNDEAQLLASLWDSIEGYISTGEKQEVAEHIIRGLITHGFDLNLLHDAEGNCQYLDKALDNVAEEESDVESDLFDEYGE